MTVATPGGPPSDASQVELVVPSELHTLRLLRLAVADAAATVGFTTDRIDRLRVAVDELAALLINVSDAPRFTVVITRHASAVEVDGCIPFTGDTPEVDDVVAEVLDMCTVGDSWRVWVEAGQLQFRVGVQKG